jgi:hypothetical protein
MKKVKLIAVLSSIFISTNPVFSQVINWASMEKDQRHIVNIHAGIDFGVAYGISYGYQLKTPMPILLTIEQVHPSGNQIFDDFKTKIGGQIRWLQVADFQFSTKIQGIFRRFQNPVVRMSNFGSDLSGTFGYYKPKWFVAADVGFDKAIVTHFKHDKSYKDDFQSVQDGWYEPTTGGNFYYGLQTGFSFNKNDITLKLGKVIMQDFKSNPFIPFYAQLGYSRRF